MKIRAAQLADSADLAVVQIESYRTAYTHIFPPEYLAHFTQAEQTQDWHDLISQNQLDILRVAENEGAVVGYALGRAGATGVATYDAELVSLHVRPQFHGQGLGRKLVGAIAQALKQQGCTSLLLWVLEQNTKARGFYAHLGGELGGRKEIELGDAVKAFEVAYGWATLEKLF